MACPNSLLERMEDLFDSDESWGIPSEPLREGGESIQCSHCGGSLPRLGLKQESRNSVCCAIPNPISREKATNYLVVEVVSVFLAFFAFLAFLAGLVSVVLVS